MPQLDGMRAVAIVLVLGFHLGTILFGWSGVQIFFVLSGFLITGILRRARNDHYFWRPFYIRRVTRIVPPLIIFFVLVTLNHQMTWGWIGLAYVFFLANFIQAMPDIPLNDVGVTWSLAVEEHFYFIWPLAVRHLSRRSLFWVCGGIIVLSPIARAVATPHLSTWRPVYYWTPFQLDGLALGALIALLLEMEGNRRWLAKISLPLAALFLCLLIVLHRNPGFSHMQNSVLFAGTGYSLILLASGALLVHLVLCGNSPVSKCLAWEPFAFLGRISYGVYLFHYPAIRFAEASALHLGIPQSRRIRLAGVCFGILASWLSFTLYESPIIAWGRRHAQPLSGPRLPGFLRS